MEDKFIVQVQDKYFQFIKSGEKKIEGRLAKEKYRLLKTGESIFFTNGKETLEKKLTAIFVFKNFEKAFDILDYKLAIPDAQDIGSAIKVYEEIYSPEEQLKYDIVFLGLE